MVRYGNQKPTFEVIGDYAYSVGPKIVAQFERMGRRYYPSQKYQLELFGARMADGRFAARTIGLSEPRQNGKSYGARDYSISCGVGGLSVLYSAHNGTTVRKMYRYMSKTVDSDRGLRRRLKYESRSQGGEGLYFASGGMVEFQTRTTSGGRGGTYDVIIFDEAQELTYDQLDAVKPTTIASESGDPQMIYLGTPPGPRCPGEVFRDLHDAAHDGTLGGAWWFEWSVDKVPDLSDREQALELAYLTNPAMGYRIREDVMLDAIDSYRARPDSFAREYLNWWSPVGNVIPAIDLVSWRECVTKHPPTDGKVSFGIKFNTDGMFAAIAACRLPKDGIPHIELVDVVNVAVSGLDSVAKFAYERRDTASYFAIDGKSGTMDLVARLKDLGMPKKGYGPISVGDYTTATSMLVNAVRERGITHYDQQALNESITKTVKRKIGNAGNFGFGGEYPEYADACAMALWAARVIKRDPQAKAVMLQW